MHSSRPGVAPLTPRSPRVVAARRLLRRRHRDLDGLFLAEGPQAVREALGPSHAVAEIFVVAGAHERHLELISTARGAGVPVCQVTEQALAGLAETVTPQGIVAVCRQHHHDSVLGVVGDRTRLVVILAGISDPGNAGTVLRTADAAGADAVVFTAGSVDPYNGKCVRSSAGSIFHLPIVRGESVEATVRTVREHGIRVLAADAHGPASLDVLADSGALAGPVAWLLGSEAHGLPDGARSLADDLVRVPMYGRAESLNLATAAALCLFASARAHHVRAH